MKIADQILIIRKERGMTQREVADRMGMTVVNYGIHERRDSFSSRQLYKLMEIMEFEIVIKIK